jgi:S-DNA-T family DNA segregation ATPase FtsK/SpoIIIE
MPERSVSQHERRLLRDLTRLVSERAAGEASLAQRWKSGSAKAEREHERTVQKATEEFEKIRAQLEAEHRAAAASLTARFETLIRPAQQRMERQVSTYNGRTGAMGGAAQREFEESTWLAETMVESGGTRIKNQYELLRKAVESRQASVKQVHDAAQHLLAEYRLPPMGDVAPAALAAPDTRDACLKALDESRQSAVSLLNALERTIRPKALRNQPAVIYVVLAGAIGAGLAWYSKQSGETAATIGLVAAFAMFALVAGLRWLVRRGASVRASALAAELAKARALGESCYELADRLREQEKQELIAKRTAELDKAEKRLNAFKREIVRRNNVGSPRLREIHAGRLRRLREKQAAEQARIDSARDTALAVASAQRDRVSAEAAQKRDAALADLRALDTHERTIFVNAWKDGLARIHADVEELHEFARAFPSWDTIRTAYNPPEELPVAVRVGEVAVDMAALEGGLPQSEDFQVPGPTSFALPAVLDFTDIGSLLVKAPAAERARALDLLNAAMLRILTALPPGKARFTIIDPIGLGESFAGFMHLADHEEALVSNKIWTEPRHIEQRLTDLTEHMETVIQKYLRNEYESIRDYNKDAGEIAEPLRFLVFADFPANLNEAAAKRLASIITSGPRCGVYTLIAGELKGKLPSWLPLAELERNSVSVRWEGGRWQWSDDDFGRWPLTLDTAPAESVLTELVHKVGRTAKDSSRVQVPFEAIAPQNGQVWSLSAAEEIRVPLGRSGAKKLQYITLGRGTAQHALVAGRTGSGKSTLFHVLITSLGLWYSPDEVELYLVDFKKGVEFKTYASHRLPHARVIAVESEREFGISVLRRLDAELTRRGSLFRDAGVQDMAGYRRDLKRRGDEETRSGSDPLPLSASSSLPRILFLVDEFQEFFVEDDKIAQEASLLLDRLVRQGRAFGIHVVLGSQTLGGAYSIARSTIGQMAVRIALQCSEADSYLIMSEDNAAPRLLSRPGEAIYNDASGLVEGNSPFQIVWLPDERRDVFLERIDHSLETSGRPRPPGAVVFEGNIPADISRNHLLDEALAGKRASGIPSAWLGDAISIKDPTSIAFKRQSGSNLLIIGQQEDAIPPMLTGILLGLRSTSPSSAIHVLESAGEDVESAPQFRHAAQSLGAKLGSLRDTSSIIAALAEELTRRESGESQPTPAFLLIHGLHRFRDLRKTDDYSFSMDDKPQTPSQLFARILRDGPGHGLHVIAWIDTVNNLERALERNLLKEFENRVLFQMSATDSTHLIESPAAANLGRYRALLHREELGQSEKFRPYAAPDDNWLRASLSRLGSPAPSGTRT